MTLDWSHATYDDDDATQSLYIRLVWITLQAASIILQRAPADGSQWNTWATKWSWAVCIMNEHILQKNK